MSTNEKTCASELDWLAFCYAAGELSEPDAAQFEARLATDQPAREALARAVNLSQTIAAAESVGWALPTSTVSLPTRQTKRPTFERIGIAIGIAAAILLALNLAGVFNLTAPIQQPSPLQARLASAWTQTRAQMASDSADDLWPALDALQDVEDDLLTDLVPAEVPQAPSWLTAALLGQMPAAPVTDSLNNGPIEN